MKLVFRLLIVLTITICCVRCSVKQTVTIESERWNYEIEAMQTGIQGTYQVKIWTYTTLPDQIIALAKLNAVHGILFKGYPAKGSLVGNEPLLGREISSEANVRFFEEFFAPRGQYLDFVSLAHGGAIMPGDRIRIDRRTYKIGIVASVKVAELRRELEKQGVIRTMNYGF